MYKVAWSDFFNSYIMCVKYNNDTDWCFVTIDKNRNPTSRVMRAQTSYRNYKWSN